LEELTEIDTSEDLSVEERVILKWIFKMWNGVAWTGLLWLSIGTVGGFL
jgi:hypothetical protein